MSCQEYNVSERAPEHPSQTSPVSGETEATGQSSEVTHFSGQSDNKTSGTVFHVHLETHRDLENRFIMGKIVLYYHECHVKYPHSIRWTRKHLSWMSDYFTHMGIQYALLH